MGKDILEYIGKSLYKTKILKELKRYLVFRVRCNLHKDKINDLLAFFSENTTRQAWLLGTPSLVEQSTRSFFYKDSTWNERTDLIKKHIEIMEEHFSDSLMNTLYKDGDRVKLWEDVYLDKPLIMNLYFHAGQRKEGCLSFVLEYENEPLYQIMFWFGNDMSGQGKTIYVGALQGPQNGSDLIKGLTKAFFGYRTKNLVFYVLRSLAKNMDIENIYAVANEGYYAMNHIRLDRKLKTDFGTFWQECEGKVSVDHRFYVMPTQEYRKSMEELKPSKRAQHRRRFAKLDEIDCAIKNALNDYKK